MKKQSGFTLIELMVVMAIIAILATAGLAAYMGYIRKARDTTRIADIATINKAVLTIVTQSGQSPTSIADVITAIKAVNSGVSLKDPLSTKDTCLSAAGVADKNCDYYYTQCDAGAGFAVGTRFESTTNSSKYGYDNLDTVAAVTGGNGTASNADDFYSMGSCDAYCATISSCGSTSVWTYAEILPTA